MNISKFEFKNSINEFIKGDLYFNKKNGKSPLIIMLHGFKAWRKWGFMPYFSNKLALNNSIVLNIDHSLNGIVDENIPMFDSEKFSRQTVSQYIEDVKLTIENFKSGLISKEILEFWNGKIYLVGHSLGAAVSLLVYNKYKNIDKIVILGGISKIDRNTIRQKELWKEQGYVDIRIAMNNQILKLNYSHIEDKENYSDNILIETMQKSQIPVLIIHGGLDMTVKRKEAIDLYENASDKKITELLIVEKTGHTFGTDFKFTDTNVALEKVIEKTIEFLNINE